MRAIFLISVLFFVFEGHAHGRLADVWRSRLVLPTATQAKKLLLHGVTAAVLSCTPLGCGVRVQEHPTAVVQESAVAQESKAAFFVNKNVHFRIDGRSYRGRVERIAENENEVVVIPRYDSEKIVAIEDISGVRIDQHWLLFETARIPIKNHKLCYLQGIVEAIYTDGYAAIRVTLEVDHPDHNRHRVGSPYDAFYPIQQLTLLENKQRPERIATR